MTSSEVYATQENPEGQTMPFKKYEDAPRSEGAPSFRGLTLQNR